MNLQGVNIIIAFCFNTNLLLCNFAARFISRDQNSTILTEIKDYGQKKNDKKNKYNIVCFTSSKGKHRTKLKENINPSKVNEICYVLRNPSVVKRKAIGQEINGYKITNKKDKALVKFITRKKN